VTRRRGEGQGGRQQMRVGRKEVVGELRVKRKINGGGGGVRSVWCALGSSTCIWQAH